MKRTDNPQINTKEYWDKVYLSERGSGKRRIDDERFEFVSEYLEGIEYGLFLDVGCGNGELIARLYEKYPQITFTGVDIANGTIANAMNDYPHLHFVVGNADDLPLTSDRYDIVFCGETIEHTLHPMRLIGELNRVTKPGGVFIVSTPNEHRNPSDEHTYEFDPMDLIMCKLGRLIDFRVVCNGISMIASWQKVEA